MVLNSLVGQTVNKRGAVQLAIRLQFQDLGRIQFRLTTATATAGDRVELVLPLHDPGSMATDGKTRIHPPLSGLRIERMNFVVRGPLKHTFTASDQ